MRNQVDMVQSRRFGVCYVCGFGRSLPDRRYERGKTEDIREVKRDRTPVTTTESRVYFCCDYPLLLSLRSDPGILTSLVSTSPSHPPNHPTLQIMLASYHGHLPLVHLLLQHGADPNTLNDRGQSPLAGAVFKNEEEIIKALLEGVSFDLLFDARSHSWVLRDEG